MYLLLLLLISQLTEWMDMKAPSSLSAVINTHYQNKNRTNEWVHIISCFTKKVEGKASAVICTTLLKEEAVTFMFALRNCLKQFGVLAIILITSR